MRWLCLFFHSWSLWEMFEKQMMHIPERGDGIAYIQRAQRRRCSRCGKYQEEEL